MNATMMKNNVAKIPKTPDPIEPEEAIKKVTARQTSPAMIRPRSNSSNFPKSGRNHCKT